jgi:heat shock protein HspQ
LKKDTESSVSNGCQVNARFKIGQKVKMKDTDGYFAIVMWVKSTKYNNQQGRWDYVVQKQAREGDWTDGEHVRKETDLTRAD